MSPALPSVESGASLASALSTMAYRQRLEAALPAFLAEHRWFADRSSGPSFARIEETVPLAFDGNTVLVIVALETATGLSRYQLPLLAPPQGGVVDALDTAAGAEAFVESVLHACADPRRTIVVVDASRIAGQIRVHSGEQSNTSVMIGERAVLKLFRRVESGRNPDVELPAWLSGPGGFANVPRTLAWARLDLPGWTTDSLVIQEFVENDGDGWQWALRLAGDAARAVGDGVPFDDWLASPRGRELLDGAASLGGITAAMHLALSTAQGQGLGPAPFAPADWDGLVESLRGDLDAALSWPGGHPAGAATALRVLRARLPAAPDGLGWKTRIHGDYHLGQVLHASRGWVIVDFEGEPARTLEERVALQHPLADVAGMIRSWDYAGASGAGPGIAASWANAATVAFLGAYREGTRGAAFLPSTPEAEGALLRLFLLRKALYELRYELGSRPTWAAIPLAALERMAEELP